MKFWKILKGLIDEVQPDWRDKFLSYKDLKKQLKLVYPRDGSTRVRPLVKRLHLDSTEGGGDCTVAAVGEEVVDFLELLDGEINKINEFFMDREEDHIIRWADLQDRVAKAEGVDSELMEVRREIVDFHGEMVLLENYSALNCIGLVKIIKKYDKRSGAVICLPFIRKVLQQPFCRTDVLKKFAKECERVLDQLLFENDRQTDETTVVENEIMESMYKRLTLSALRVFEEIRSGSSTVSMFSLPPLHNNQKGED
ncbi:SPX domain-containing protein 1-like [Rhodamnia argentea]|uniref:SPX domain-containing protein 1-like n=1 Tax=Rhodamnia argentea TaxID=178133 RepID=A0ABM3HAI1_9MYRT|nr:SPX domain-containing protein 1-like [Rhodamnia argentea]XP_048133594.1 SPX domain-containing protein 1-like [Rhodamnia argentea]